MTVARLLLVVAVLTGPAAARERIFADTCRERESDDTAGSIVTLRDAKPVVALQWSDGALHARVAASTVRRAGSRLAFTVVTPDGTFTFAGRLGHHRLSGVLNEPWQASQHVKLSERSREAAEHPAPCR